MPQEMILKGDRPWHTPLFGSDHWTIQYVRQKCFFKLYCIYLCATYFAKCATNSFCNMNAIEITWLIVLPQ